MGKVGNVKRVKKMMGPIFRKVQTDLGNFIWPVAILAMKPIAFEASEEVIQVEAGRSGLRQGCCIFARVT